MGILSVPIWRGNKNGYIYVFLSWCVFEEIKNIELRIMNVALCV
jgi:hypothetical protein